MPGGPLLPSPPMTDPGGRAALSAITHGDRAFHHPLGLGKLDRLIAQAALGPGDQVLDVGCGPGELLLRIAERHGAGGLGVDLAAGLIERARAAAAVRAPAADLRFEAQDARGLEAPPGGLEGFALAACLGSTHALGGLDATLERLAALTRPGGHVLIGDGYWRRPPEAPYLEVLGATADELPDHAGLVRAGERYGLRPVGAATASEDEWDEYEWTLIGNGERHLAAHPDDPGGPALRAWVDAARDRYLAPGGRDTLGFAVVLWLREGPA